MKITKTTTKTYEILDYVNWNFSIGETLEKRKKLGIPIKGLNKCFICDYKFKDTDIPYLGIIKNYKNQFICENCTTKI